MSRAIATMAGLLSHAHAIETEAVERYELLADQMEVHNNPEVSALFRKLARIEAKHAAQIEDEARTQGTEIARLSPWEYDWPDVEAPETAAIDEAHYRMTPHHALTMALAGEERALRFFEHAAATAGDPEVEAMAQEFAADEARHVALIKDWLAQHPAPETGWAEDPDPPVWSE